MLRSLIPWRETLPRSISRFEDEMERMMEDFFGRRESMLGGEMATSFVPTTNVAENENELEVTIDLPGLKPEEVNLELREGALWITGQRKEEKEEKDCITALLRANCTQCVSVKSISFSCKSKFILTVKQQCVCDTSLELHT